jgi:hypothetical protein
MRKSATVQARRSAKKQLKNIPFREEYIQKPAKLIEHESGRM